MSRSIYDDKLIEPDEKMLAYDLGETFTFYKSIVDYIKNEFGDSRPEWKYYNSKSGWVHKVFNKKRNVLFISPHQGFFNLTMVFGGKAADKIFASDVSEETKKQLFEAKKYAEGRGLQFEVKSKEVTDEILKLIRIKLEN